MDGSTWELTSGVDFDGKASALRNRCYTVAKAHGKRATVSASTNEAGAPILRVRFLDDDAALDPVEAPPAPPTWVNGDAPPGPDIPHMGVPMPDSPPLRMDPEDVAALPWRKVSSTSLARVAHMWGGDGDGFLFCDFHGRLYRYEGVPHETFDALLEANATPDVSVGRVVNATVKGAYPCRLVEAHGDEDA